MPSVCMDLIRYITLLLSKAFAEPDFVYAYAAQWTCLLGPVEESWHAVSPAFDVGGLSWLVCLKLRSLQT